VTAEPLGLDAQRQSELQSLRETVRAFCNDAGGAVAVRRLKIDGPGFDTRLWDVLGVQIGLAGLGLPEEAGGMGGLAEVTAVCEELGRALLPVPFLTSTVLTGQVLAAVGAPALAALSRVAAGEVAALAALGPDGIWDPAEVTVTATGGPSCTVEGVVPFVLDGAAAAFFVVAEGHDRLAP
jgi:alkylation response protein AidB-like acyl-CoA dehydrogenase